MDLLIGLIVVGPLPFDDRHPQVAPPNCTILIVHFIYPALLLSSGRCRLVTRLWVPARGGVQAGEATKDQTRGDGVAAADVRVAEDATGRLPCRE